jgi:hypothetical protein
LVTVLHARHGPVLRRKAGRLEYALARYLVGKQVGANETIHKDMLFIRKRLGARWYDPGEERSSGQSAGPGDSPN